VSSIGRHIAILVVAAGPLAAQPNDADSARTTVLPQIVVEAESIVARTAAATQPTSIVSREAIEASHARDASDVVAMVPGAFVRQYGGTGGLRTLSLRGTSAQQSVVLVDGVRYQSTAAGGIDLGSIPASVLQRVEVVRGGDAARFGANALGGAVNLITIPSLDAASSLGVQADVGSFGERAATLSASASGASYAASGSLTMSHADGDYPFVYREYGEQTTIRRENSDLTTLFARAALSHGLGGGARLGISAIGFDSERGVPGAIVQGHREQLNARLAERELFTTVRTSIDRSEWQGTLAWTGRVNRLSFRDPDARLNGPDGIDNRYDRVESALLARARHAVGSHGLVEAAAEAAYARLDGNNLDPAVGGVAERLQWSASMSASWLFDSLVAGSDVALDIAARADGFSDVSSAFSPSVGLAVRPLRGALRLRAHGALNYRVPSFTEQYYLNYGNSSLRPERSRSFDVGATYEVTPSMLLAADAFAIDTRDQIIAVPRSPIVWSAQNVARTLTRGVELSATGTLADGLVALNLSYTRMRAEDRTDGLSAGKLLVYSPEELLFALAEVRPGRFTCGVTWQHVSHRHTLPSNAVEGVLPRYATLGAHVGARGTLGVLTLAARVEGSNLLDEQYQVVRNYPMPGRSVRLSVEVGYAVR
jgi:vitamin B12 transporter